MPAGTFKRAAALVIAGTAAILFGLQIVPVNLERACAADDTPYLDLCAWTGAPGSTSRVRWLKQRVAADPGDAEAVVQLAYATRGDEQQQWLRQAIALAPTNVNVLALRAQGALERKAWGDAVEPLVRLADQQEHRGAAQALAQLVLAGEGARLKTYLRPGNRWLPAMLASMQEGRIPQAAALPLVADALRAGALPQDQGLSYIASLKSSQAWPDAYALWVALHDKPLPLVYNGDFSEPFQSDGFDWEIPSESPRSGVAIERELGPGKTFVLALHYNGRQIPVPQLRQFLYLPPGRYRLKGSYSSKLRLDDGLAWTLTCTATNTTAGRTEPLADTAGLPREFALDFEITPACGLVTTLQLETFSALSAATGGRGRAEFDDIEVTRLR